MIGPPIATELFVFSWLMLNDNADGRVDADQSATGVHCCKPLNPLHWCCIALSPGN